MRLVVQVVRVQGNVGGVGTELESRYRCIGAGDKAGVQLVAELSGTPDLALSG